MPRAWSVFLVLWSMSVASAQTVAERYGKLPLGFEVNRGQTDSRVKFLSRGRGYTLFLTSNEAVLANPPNVARMKLIGANKKPSVSGEDPLPGRSNYFIGNDPQKWLTDVPTYAKVRYRQVSGVIQRNSEKFSTR